MSDGRNQPDLITVSISHREEIAADHAHLYVVIQGQSLVTGRSALKKAQEVKVLVTGLMSKGVDEADIHLQAVHAEVSSGLLGRSSSARYSLRIRCREMGSMPDLLGVITSQKNTTLQGIVWGYEDDEERLESWLESCLNKANRKAARIAAISGVKLEGIHSFTDRVMDPEAEPRQPDMHLHVHTAARMKREAAPDLGMELTHTKLVRYEVQVSYRVSGFVASGPPG